MNWLLLAGFTCLFGKGDLTLQSADKAGFLEYYWTPQSASEAIVGFG